MADNKKSAPSKWLLHVDCNEPKAGDVADQLRSPSLDTVVTNLEVSDFAFEKDGRIWCMVERKTVPDLLSSIKGGRYHDQVFRLLKSEAPFLWVLVEGSLKGLDGPDLQRFMTATMHIQMEKNIKVSYADHSGYAKPFLTAMHKKLCDNPSEDRITAPLLETIQSNCKKRKMNTQNIVYIMQLAVVEGMSPEKAKSISLIYPDWSCLLAAYKRCNTEGERKTLLVNVKTGERNLGKALSEKIYNCVKSVSEDALPMDEEHPLEKSPKKKAKRTTKKKAGLIFGLDAIDAL